MLGTASPKTYDDWKRHFARLKKERAKQGKLTARERKIQQINQERIMALSAQRRQARKDETDRQYHDRLQPGLEWLSDKAKGRPLAERHGPDAYLEHAFPSTN